MGFKPGIYAYGLGYESDLRSSVLDKTEHDFSTTYYTFHFEIVTKRARKQHNILQKCNHRHISNEP